MNKDNSRKFLQQCDDLFWRYLSELFYLNPLDITTLTFTSVWVYSAVKNNCELIFI